MLDLLTISLEAHSNERNHHRRYEVSVGCDLLGHWVVTVRYGRVGGPLRAITCTHADEGEAQSMVQERLGRRLSAPRRIGCAYRIRELIVPARMPLSNWLPASTIAALAA
ncbi:MAG: WGR domain-containing protein [Phycisphaerales bacterium]|nr:WGR domain-containing protein [Phycisphaerales bacterium]